MQDTDSSYPTFHVYTIHTPPCIPACNPGRCKISTTNIWRINRNYPPPAGLACLQQGPNGQEKETCRRCYAQLFAQGHGHGKIKHGKFIYCYCFFVLYIFAGYVACEYINVTDEMHIYLYIYVYIYIRRPRGLWIYECHRRDAHIHPRTRTVLEFPVPLCLCVCASTCACGVYKTYINRRKWDLGRDSKTQELITATFRYSAVQIICTKSNQVVPRGTYKVAVAQLLDFGI